MISGKEKSLTIHTNVDIQLRFALLGHSDRTIKKHYTNLSDIEVIKKIKKEAALLQPLYLNGWRRADSNRRPLDCQSSALAS